MSQYWRHVHRVLKEADIILCVLDARMPQETRYHLVEKKITAQGKKIIYVLNKVDLITQKEAEEIKKEFTPCVFVSSTQRLGTTLLKKKILEVSRGEQVVVGVVGFPNVGKSSVINALAGRAKARTSAQSGYTKGMQKVRVNQKIVLLDSPGVFPPLKDKDMVGRTGAVSAEKLHDPESVALRLLQDFSQKLAAFYKVAVDEPEDMLEAIAVQLGYLLKGGVGDVDRAARRVVQDWQRGEIT